MNAYESIQPRIDRARLGHVVVLAEAIGEGLASTWKAASWFVSAVIAAERAKDPDKVFTFEA